MSKDFALILTAAGKSERFNSGKKGEKKEYVLLGGRSVIQLALEPFLSFPELKRIVVTVPLGEEKAMRKHLSYSGEIPLSFVEGGASRTESIGKAMALLKDESGFSLIAVHDGARPFIDRATIERTLSGAEKYGGAVPGLAIADALKRADSDLFAKENVERDCLFRIQTPQIFNASSIIKAYLSIAPGESFKDDAELYTSRGGKCKIVEGDKRNIKITWKEDAEVRKEMRIGFGNDIHRLERGRVLWIGGVRFDHSKGEVAHSDGDVLLHAIIDAILGAKAMGDIGTFFPPEDDKWKDADSRSLLASILEYTQADIINLDATVTLEEFRLNPHIKEIRESLSFLLSLPVERISVKAKTNEGMGEIGRGDAIKAEAVVLIRE